MGKKKPSKSQSKSNLLETSSEQDTRDSKEKVTLIPKIHFYAWFDQQVRAGNLKPWQELEIKTFFREKGLDEIEEPKIFDKFLKIY